MNSPDRSGITVSARSYTTFWDTIHAIVGTRSTASWAAIPREGGQLV